VGRVVGRPPLGNEPRQLIAIRVDPGVLDRFRREAPSARGLPDTDQRGARSARPQRRGV